MNDAWIADRMKHIDASGIRKAFDMSKSMKDPINLSIGLPDFDVPEPGQGRGDRGDRSGAQRLHGHPGHPRAAKQDPGEPSTPQFGHADRQVLITAGTSGGLLLALCCVVNPGDEVIIFDPYFVMYRHLATLAGGVSVLVDTYPDFRIDAAKVEAAMTARTKCVVVNTPANPTGVVATADEMRALAELCRRARRPLDQRRGLPGLLLRSSLRHAGKLERGRAGRRRLQQDLRHDRLAARLCPRARAA